MAVCGGDRPKWKVSAESLDNRRWKQVELLHAAALCGVAVCNAKVSASCIRATAGRGKCTGSARKRCKTRFNGRVTARDVARRYTSLIPRRHTRGVAARKNSTGILDTMRAVRVSPEAAGSDQRFE
ncbi:hypothetical protein JG687_00008454 [Phytophthora cactorum]|uniref:Uncharacterized protein n=1 Tax=Phytophthora cactorum TaxID=29920 RepID=A0A329RTH2_9STRA|nr:hypothetical protein Pcac1_g25506 [Phytophthora cactorum]KAG2812527.1 hypothetical protein PC112_g15140 [Phytophthora cactorum]KAG2814241.1 hypothetical protein PC111_g14067 [Phytophthora cactorum]KAG2852057.1 hypothetical protein PC113_g15362 [Phytophthora cactorum]KAG2905746.1 hypothetical protein PC115_g14519 [Phytophthora cactorum]